jgi:hemimethylated DNA binding protein
VTNPSQLLFFDSITAGQIETVFEVLRLGHLRQRQLSEQGGRTGKPDNVEFSIGQVVKHKRYGYRGVLVGWDKVCSAPKEWQEAMRIDQLQDKDGQAFYHTLVDTRDRNGMLWCIQCCLSVYVRVYVYVKPPIIVKFALVFST